MQRIFILMQVLFVLGMLFSSCQLIQPEPLPRQENKDGVELMFETIERLDPSISNSLGGSPIQNEWPVNWNDPKPGLIVIASSQEIAPVSQYITDKVRTELETMDFSNYFALIAFDGWKSTLHSHFEIQKVIKADDQVFVFVQPSQAGPQAAISSLYHLIRIKKEAKWGGKYTFYLYISNEKSNDVLVSIAIP